MYHVWRACADEVIGCPQFGVICDACMGMLPRKNASINLPCKYYSAHSQRKSSCKANPASTTHGQLDGFFPPQRSLSGLNRSKRTTTQSNKHRFMYALEYPRSRSSSPFTFLGPSQYGHEGAHPRARKHVSGCAAVFPAISPIFMPLFFSQSIFRLVDALRLARWDESSRDSGNL